MSKVVIRVAGLAGLAGILGVESVRMAQEPSIVSAVWIVTAIFCMALAILPPPRGESS